MESEKGCCIELHAPGKSSLRSWSLKRSEWKERESQAEEGCQDEKMASVPGLRWASITCSEKARNQSEQDWDMRQWDEGIRASPCRPQWKSTWVYSKYVVFLVAQTVKDLPAIWETWVLSLVWEDYLKKGMATHTSILACRITWTEEPGRLQSVGS